MAAARKYVRLAYADPTLSWQTIEDVAGSSGFVRPSSSATTPAADFAAAATADPDVLCAALAGDASFSYWSQQRHDHFDDVGSTKLDNRNETNNKKTNKKNVVSKPSTGNNHPDAFDVSQRQQRSDSVERLRRQLLNEVQRFHMPDDGRLRRLMSDRLWLRLSGGRDDVKVLSHTTERKKLLLGEDGAAPATSIIMVGTSRIEPTSSSAGGESTGRHVESVALVASRNAYLVATPAILSSSSTAAPDADGSVSSQLSLAETGLGRVGNLSGSAATNLASLVSGSSSSSRGSSTVGPRGSLPQPISVQRSSSSLGVDDSSSSTIRTPQGGTVGRAPSSVLTVVVSYESGAEGGGTVVVTPSSLAKTDSSTPARPDAVASSSDDILNEIEADFTPKTGGADDVNATDSPSSSASGMQRSSSAAVAVRVQDAVDHTVGGVLRDAFLVSGAFHPASNALRATLRRSIAARDPEEEINASPSTSIRYCDVCFAVDHAGKAECALFHERQRHKDRARHGSAA